MGGRERREQREAERERECVCGGGGGGGGAERWDGRERKMEKLTERWAERVVSVSERHRELLRERDREMGGWGGQRE